MEVTVAPKAGNFTASMESEGPQKVSRTMRRLSQKLQAQGTPWGNKEKMVTSAVACALFLSWLLPKADLGPISVFFFFN